MPSSYLPPGCGRLPGEEPEEPQYWQLAEQVAKKLAKDHVWKERGNRDDYIASDCWKDADLDGISTGILSIVGNDTGITVRWGWYVTFCSGDERANDTAHEIVSSGDLMGSCDVDNDGDGASWTMSGDEDFHIDMEGVTSSPDDTGLVATALASKAVWERFCKERETVEKEAEYTHKALEENYMEATKVTP
jgi:hypothetical protein